MTERLIALIRGINVGRAKRVPMVDLRALIGALGYTDVRTLLNSGNVVFTDNGTAANNPGARIEEAIASQLGVSALVIVLTASELVAIVRENPLLDLADDPSRLLVAVLNVPADRTLLEPLLKQDWDPEILALGPRVAYLWCPDGILAGRLPETIGRVVGDSATTRNWRTITKIHALVDNQP